MVSNKHHMFVVYRIPQVGQHSLSQNRNENLAQHFLERCVLIRFTSRECLPYAGPGIQTAQCSSHKLTGGTRKRSSWEDLSYTHTHTHLHTYKHAHMHMGTHTCTHRHTHANIQTHAHAPPDGSS